jgi:uncharacterized protein (DUF1330 family)
MPGSLVAAALTFHPADPDPEGEVMIPQQEQGYLDRRTVLRSGLASASVIIMSAGHQILAQEVERIARRAYVMGYLEIRDPSWVKEYGPKNDALVQKHGGRFLVKSDAVEALEGGSKLPNLVVILEFPSLEHARNWYHDPDYVPLIKLRQTGSDAELILVEGLA